MLDRQLQTDKVYSGVVTTLGNDAQQAVGTLTFKGDQGLLLEVPYAFSTAHDREQFRAAADWFEHREMPEAVLFRGEDINVTLYGCRFASRSRVYGRGVAVGRMVADYAVLFNRSLSKPFEVRTVRSQMDGLRRWTDYSGALVEHELDDNNLVQSMSITVRGTTDLTWSHVGATMTLGTYWEGRDGDRGPGVQEWVTVSSTFEDGALPDRHIAAQEVLRDLLILSFGTPIRFRRHAASDPSMPSDVQRTRVTAPPFRDLIVRETEDEFFQPVVPTARQPILLARDISAESLEAWSLLRAEWSRAIDPLILLLNRDIFAVEDIILQSNISLEAAGHLLPPVEGEEATRRGNAPTTATRVLRALRELTVPWDLLRAPEIGVARLIANTYNSIKHFDRTTLTDRDHLRLVANVSQLLARLVVLAQLPESAGFIDRFCARDLARVMNQFQTSGVLIVEDGTLVPRPIVLRDGDRQ